MILPTVAITSVNRECIGNSPAVSKTPPQTTLRYTGYSRPFSQCVSFTVIGYAAIVAGVVGLFKVIGPSAVIWAITLIIVNPIHGVIIPWPRPHVCQKVFKGFTPARANANPPTTIEGVLRVVGVVTSLIHRAPSVMFWRSGHAVFSLNHPATTTFLRFILPQKRGCRQSSRFSAIAFTQPLRIGVIVAHVTNNGQAAESLAGQVLSNTLRNGYNLRSHFRTSNAIVMRGLCGVRSALQSPLFYHNRTSVQLGTV